MSVRLDENEIEEFLRFGHTVIMTSNGKGRYPHPVPLWYVYLEGDIFVRIQTGSQKTLNIARDDRVSCLVETGEDWLDLKAVIVRGRASEVTDRETVARFTGEFERKYEAFRPSQDGLPRRSASRPFTVYRVRPEGKIISWWNRKIRAKAS